MGGGGGIFLLGSVDVIFTTTHSAAAGMPSPPRNCIAAVAITGLGFAAVCLSGDSPVISVHTDTATCATVARQPPLSVLFSAVFARFVFDLLRFCFPAIDSSRSRQFLFKKQFLCT